MKFFLIKYGFPIFWILLLPFCMLITSIKFAENPPKYRNIRYQWSGYRFGRAGRSKETWEFSQRYFFAVEQWISFFEILGSIAAIIIWWERILLISFQLEVIAVQLVLLLIPAIPTEIMLHKLFDKSGKEKSGFK